ncbi:unnamed protein product [Acanthoscelides obtectus]|uniref:Uncharacterized protein n=1 Tax=Acanthoscelides obtectus TaxID=200917 RepID=A0A9P0M3M8_ACAOB|nr:unnamed protein product [Acanthoscelides obtectus]CAK1652174.1 hypothetical protein AOBTE_LOCUS17719 [Acanthoscelides obtectus]
MIVYQISVIIVSVTEHFPSYDIIIRTKCKIPNNFCWFQLQRGSKYCYR